MLVLFYISGAFIFSQYLLKFIFECDYSSLTGYQVEQFITQTILWPIVSIAFSIIGIFNLTQNFPKMFLVICLINIMAILFYFINYFNLLPHVVIN